MNAANEIPNNWPKRAAFWLSLSLLVMVPISFSDAVYRIYVLPKFALLLTGTSLILILLTASFCAGGYWPRLLRSKLVLIVSLYITVVAISTLLGADPLASFFGSSYNQMGLMTQLSFFVFFIGLIIGAGASEARLKIILWAITVAGFLVAIYGVVQFFGLDPFVSPGLYTFGSAEGPVLRPASSLGHANYMGNFLLYTTPVSAGMALATRGRACTFAVTATSLSICAITFSGTRGAWLGLAAGAVAFSILEVRKHWSRALRGGHRQMVRKVAPVIITFLILVTAISLNPASRNIFLRAHSLIAEGFTGAGRTLLWRDSVKMAPDFAFRGVGQEGFRKAFLSYKSKDLARFAPQVNNESSHNSYLDAAISYGLAGAILYVAIFASAISLLFAARRKESSQLRMIASALIASFVAVATHNNFIYDQISTGLYFFAFAAMAQIIRNRSLSVVSLAEPLKEEQRKRAGLRAKTAMVAAACGVAAMSVWYSVSLLRADAQVNGMIASAAAGDFARMASHRSLAVSTPEPTVNYDPVFARILTSYSNRFPSDQNQTGSANPNSIWARALRIVTQDGEGALAHTFTPESDYTLMAYLALLAGDGAKLREFATEAVRWDPNFFEARWLMAESHLMEGDIEQARREARLALDLNPSSQQARSVLKRAGGESEAGSRNTERLLARGLELMDEGNTEKARRLLTRALRKSGDRCPECHRALALVYEAKREYQNAIIEWRIFMRQDPARASAEKIEARIDSLKEKM